MFLVSVLMSFAGWLAVAMAFEKVWPTVVRSLSAGSISNADVARVFWWSVGIIAFAAGGPAAAPHIVTMVPVAMSHVALSREGLRAISWHDILKHLSEQAKVFWTNFRR